MELPLANAASRRGLLIASVAITVITYLQVGRHWVADYRIQSGQLASMKSGAALEPNNAEAWDRIGRFEQYDFENPDPRQAVADYLEAVRNDPHSEHYWMDLASAYETTGNIPRARQAFEQARNVYPASAEVDWAFGNFLLRQQELAQGYAQIEKAVRADPTLLPLAITRAWRSDPNVDELLDNVLPADPEAYLQALDFFASLRDADPGLKVWQRLLTLNRSFTLSRSFPFFDELIREDRSEQARRVWREALAIARLPRAEPANHSLIWNGDFAQDFANGGLDWRWYPTLGVTIGFDSAPASHGARSIRLDFSGGTNLSLEQPVQYVPVDPNRVYQFRAYLRTERITTESGIRISIVDHHHKGAVNLTTENLTGSNPWAAQEATITTARETHFLMILLHRSPSRLFENKLSGSAWLADVSLIPSDEAGLHSP